MAKVKTGKLTGPALDWAVAKCSTKNGATFEDGRLYLLNDAGHRLVLRYAPSTDWAQAGPLLNQHKISRTIDHSGLWIAYAGYNLNDEQRHMQCDRSELVAGLRCLVALNLGEVVDVPEELL